MCHLRAITLRQALRAYERARAQFDQKRIESLLNKDHGTYAAIFNQQNAFFQNLQKDMVSSACNYLELSPDMYMKTINTYMKEQDYAVKVANSDKNTRV